MSWRKVKELSSYFADDNLSAIALQELLLKLHSLYLESNSPLFILFIKNLSGSVKGVGRKQMMPKTGEQSIFSEIHIVHTFETP